MGKPAQDVVLLFSYGTLRDGAVQMANFGRLLAGRADALPGYAIVPIEILDPAVVALSGKAQHMIAIRGNAADEVSGMVFEITAEELAAAVDKDHVKHREYGQDRDEHELPPPVG